MHDHTHYRHHHFDSKREGNKKGLTIAFIITAGIMLLEFFGGLLSNSLALLSDSGHMLSDSSSLALSLIAMWYAVKPASPDKTYGFYRFEILAALFNGMTLFVIATLIIKEAYDRLIQPQTVASGTMIVIAIIGLFANLISAWFMMTKGDVKGNINLRSAYLHVLGDALGSVGAIIAGVLMMTFSWYIADPIISVVVAVLILKSAWGVLKDTIHVLMEGTPNTVDLQEVKKTLQSIDGVVNVHDLHIWTITSGLDSLSCHLLIKDTKKCQDILQSALDRVEEKFNIKHCTIQVEKSQLQHKPTII